MCKYTKNDILVQNCTLQDSYLFSAMKKIIVLIFLFIFLYSLRNKMALIIDNMGKASAVAQKLKIPVTSADKLTNSNHILYLMAEHSTPE